MDASNISHHAAVALRAVALPDVCRVEDLAEHLDLSPATLRAALRAGVLPGRRLGRQWLISRQALLAWLAEPEDYGDQPGRGPRSTTAARADHGEEGDRGA